MLVPVRGNNGVVNAEDREQHLERFIARVDERLTSIEEFARRSGQEFELNREIQVEVLRRTGESHNEVMTRLEDLGIHMREQTQALMRINERLGP